MELIRGLHSIPISVKQWNKPKDDDPEVSYVTDR
jgi:hypothetical protein